MRYNHRDNGLKQAFGIVRKYDPATYARMTNDHSWYVTSDPTEFPQSDGAYGTTYSSANPDMMGKAVTGLNYDQIAQGASAMDINPFDFIATILVHEYTHAHQSYDTIGSADKAEPPAFRAGSAFAAKLPAPDGPTIKAMSDDTLKNLHKVPGYNHGGMEL